MSEDLAQYLQQAIWNIGREYHKQWRNQEHSSEETEQDTPAWIKLSQAYESIQRIRRSTVVGLFGAQNGGKSTIINKLIGYDIMPTKNQPTTSAVIFVRHDSGMTSGQFRLRTVFDNFQEEIDDPLSVGDIRKRLTDTGSHCGENTNGIRSLEVVSNFSDCEILRYGGILADTPGAEKVFTDESETLNDIEKKNLEDSLKAESVLKQINLVVYVTCPENTQGTHKVDFFENKLKPACKHPVFVVNKIDNANSYGDPDGMEQWKEKCNRHIKDNFDVNPIHVHYVSAKEGEGLKELQAAIRDRIACLEDTSITLLDEPMSLLKSFFDELKKTPGMGYPQLYVSAAKRPLFVLLRRLTGRKNANYTDYSFQDRIDPYHCTDDGMERARNSIITALTHFGILDNLVLPGKHLEAKTDKNEDWLRPEGWLTNNWITKNLMSAPEKQWYFLGLPGSGKTTYFSILINRLQQLSLANSSGTKYILRSLRHSVTETKKARSNRKEGNQIELAEAIQRLMNQAWPNKTEYANAGCYEFEFSPSANAPVQFRPYHLYFNDYGGEDFQSAMDPNWKPQPNAMSGALAIRDSLRKATGYFLLLDVDTLLNDDVRSTQEVNQTLTQFFTEVRVHAKKTPVAILFAKAELCYGTLCKDELIEVLNRKFPDAMHQQTDIENVSYFMVNSLGELYTSNDVDFSALLSLPPRQARNSLIYPSSNWRNRPETSGKDSVLEPIFEFLPRLRLLNRR